MRPSSDVDEIYVAPELRLDDRQSHHADMPDGVGRHKGEAESGRNHCQSPVVALAPVRWRACDALLLQYLVSIPGNFAIHAMNVGLAVHLAHRKCMLVGETMAAMHREHHLLAKQRNTMGALVGLCTRQRINDGIEVAGEE